jgi:MoaA/NifB/PqqE/SkfB family radical SAM enzyme
MSGGKFRPSSCLQDISVESYPKPLGQAGSLRRWKEVMPRTFRVRRKILAASRKWREARVFAAAMESRRHPILAQIIPIRRCNLACTYCNEYDAVSKPVPLDAMLRRIDRLGELRTSIITISGGEPLLHPDLDAIIARIRRTGAMATLISNCLLMTPERIEGLNRAGLDYLQISIDNVIPDETSKKSLKVLDRKLEWLAGHAEFAVTVNSVLGPDLRTPDDALMIARRARELGFNSTVGILHDGEGQTKPLAPAHIGAYEKIRKLETGVFSFSHFDRFQYNLARGLPNDWQCRAGSRFLYICEDGLVHYCSQQRGHPGTPLESYSEADLDREFSTVKECAPHCSISCVHQVAMLDEVRERPREMMHRMIAQRKEQDPSWQSPAFLRFVAWAFLDNPRAAAWGRAAARLLGVGRDSSRAGLQSR